MSTSGWTSFAPRKGWIVPVRKQIRAGCVMTEITLEIFVGEDEREELVSERPDLPPVEINAACDEAIKRIRYVKKCAERRTP